MNKSLIVIEPPLEKANSINPSTMHDVLFQSLKPYVVFDQIQFPANL